MLKRLRTLPGAVMIACLLLALTSAFCASRYRASEQNTDADRIKRERVLARSQALLPALMAGATAIHSELTLHAVYGESGQAQPTWIVDCSDSTSGKNAQITWNAETRDLMAAHQWTDRAPILPVDAYASRKAAIAWAWDWLDVLALRRDHESWHVVATRQRTHVEWRVDLQCGARGAQMTLNAATGQLVRMVCTPLTDTQIVRKM